MKEPTQAGHLSALEKSDRLTFEAHASSLLLVHLCGALLKAIDQRHCLSSIQL